jgi:hypothetical protein
MERLRIPLAISRERPNNRLGSFFKKMVPGLVMWRLRFLGALGPQPLKPGANGLTEAVRANDFLTETV